jgi:hypothetical protein
VVLAASTATSTNPEVAAAAAGPGALMQRSVVRKGTLLVQMEKLSVYKGERK